MRIYYNMKYSLFISVTYYLFQHNLKQTDVFLISNFRRVLNVVCFLLSNSPGNYQEESIQQIDGCHCAILVAV
jgi:hypothetical protein